MVQPQTIPWQMTQRDEGIALLVSLRLEGSKDTVCFCTECKEWWHTEASSIDSDGMYSRPTNELKYWPCDDCYDHERELRRQDRPYNGMPDRWINMKAYNTTQPESETTHEPTEAGPAAC